MELLIEHRWSVLTVVITNQHQAKTCRLGGNNCKNSEQEKPCKNNFNSKNVNNNRRYDVKNNVLKSKDSNSKKN